MMNMEDEYRQKKIDDGAVVFKWLSLILVLLIMLGLYRCATAQAPEAKLRDWGTGGWTTADTLRQAGYGVVRLYDTAQSRTIAKHPDKWKETGSFATFLYGEHPSVAEVHKFNLLVFLGVWLVAYQLDPPVRAGWQWVHIAGESYIVNENRKIGLKPDWPLFGATFLW